MQKKVFEKTNSKYDNNMHVTKQLVNGEDMCANRKC